jgi:hypothetical protein
MGNSEQVDYFVPVFLFPLTKLGTLITFRDDNCYMMTMATLFTLFAANRIYDLCTITMWKHNLSQNIVPSFIYQQFKFLQKTASVV